MPFVEMNVQEEIQKQKNNSEAFAKEWDESREEYKLIGEMIALRKAGKIIET